MKIENRRYSAPDRMPRKEHIGIQPRLPFLNVNLTNKMRNDNASHHDRNTGNTMASKRIRGDKPQHHIQ